jgi:hypothetical protein
MSEVNGKLTDWTHPTQQPYPYLGEDHSIGLMLLPTLSRTHLAPSMCAHVHGYLCSPAHLLAQKAL